jgi:hypothetical protein
MTLNKIYSCLHETHRGSKPSMALLSVRPKTNYCSSVHCPQSFQENAALVSWNRSRSLRKIMMGFWEALSPNTQKPSHWILYPHIRPFSFTSGHQQDSQAPHFLRHVLEVLSAIFPGRYIGKGGSILWPRMSPDLTPLDFLFWSYVKEYVCVDEIWDLIHFKAIIRNNNKYATTRMARSAISIGQTQGHKWCTCGNLLSSTLIEVHLKTKY